MFTSSPEARTWSIPLKPISYAQPSPPIIHWLGLANISLSARIDCNSGSVSSLNTALNLAARCWLPSPSNIWSNQSCICAFVSSEPRPFAKAEVISFATRFRFVSFAICIPKPYSALSSNSELLQAGPRPSWLTVYGVAGAEPPQIEEQPVVFATIIRSPNNWVNSFTYGVSPQPAHAPENSSNGCSNWEPLTENFFAGFSFWRNVMANAQFIACSFCSS